MILQPTETSKKVPFNPFDGPKIEKVIFCTQSQAEIWIGCKLGGEDANRSYNESVSLVLKGDLDKTALEDAIKQLVKRHESLRAIFSTDGRFMSILEEVPIPLDYTNISQLTDLEKKHEIAQYILADANMTFDLLKGPLLKTGLIRISETEHQLVLTAHHIICDGWSTGIMMEELGALYSSKVSKENIDIPKPITYSDYADEHQAFLTSEEFRKTENFWISQYQSNVPQLDLPTDFPRPKLRSYKSDRLDFPVNSDLLAKFKKIGIRAGCSFVTSLMTAFEVFLCKQTGQNDIVLGLPAAGQAITGKTQLVGHCVNLLPLRSKIDLDKTFSEYLKVRKLSLFDAFDHQQLSFGQLLQKLAIARDPSRVPLVPVVFNIDMGMSNLVSFKDLSFKLRCNPRTYETFEIFLNASGSEDDFILEWQYNSLLFKPETIKQMMTSFEEVLDIIVNDSSATIGEIVKVDASDYAELNNNDASYPQLPLHELLIKQAQNTPLKQALKFGDSEITYGDLEKQVHQVAHYLKMQGVEKGDCVAVLLPRSIELIITLIAIMECGAAYLPLDPNYPSKRLEFMLEDSESKYIITTETFSSPIQLDTKRIYLKDIFSDLSKLPSTPLNEKIDNNQIVYLLYTSGSTGKPKGVTITHKNLVNLLYSVLDKPGIEETDVLISITTVSFDIAMVELFAPLLKGAKLVLTKEETAKDTNLLLNVIKDEAITVMQATPATWQMLLYSGWDEPLPIKAISTGEALPMALAKQLLSRVSELWNMYGPTETTIWSAMKQISKEDDFVTIGRPMANTQLYIVNEENRLVKPGSVGELCIGGDGVAKGYWKRKDLTTEKFITNQFETDSNTVIYRTGDLAKLLPSGDVQCLGRIDHQVKIRGHRIELGEIEEAINTLDKVKASVVLVNEEQLEAYVILNQNEEVSNDIIDNWKNLLREELPKYMVPLDFHFVKDFPLTLNGKIDRNALKNKVSKTKTSVEYTAPRNENEKIVATIWEDCLKLTNIDIFSDFFEIGGHSLIAVKVMSVLEEKLDKRFPLSALITHPTIEELAKYITKDKESVSWNCLVPIKPNGTKTPLYMIHGAEHNVLFVNTIAKHVDPNQPVYGLQAKGLNGEDTPFDTIEDTAAHYISEIKKTNPNGPYNIGGYSFGGIVAFEMAKQLKAQNNLVNPIILLDSYVFPNYYCESPMSKKYARIKYKIEKIIFMTRKMLSSKANFTSRVSLVKKSVNNSYLRLKLGKEKQHNLLHSWPLQLDQMLAAAISKYHIKPLEIEVHLLKVEEDDIFYAHDPKFLGWDILANRGISRHIIPGNHLNMFLDPNDKKLANTIQTILDRSDE